MQARAKGLYPMGLFRSAPNFRSASHSPTDARACRIIFVCGSLAAGHTGRIKGARHGHQPVNQRKKKRDFPRRICSGRQIRARQNARSFAEYIGALPTPPADARVCRVVVCLYSWLGGRCIRRVNDVTQRKKGPLRARQSVNFTENSVQRASRSDTERQQFRPDKSKRFPLPHPTLGPIASCFF